MKQLNEKQTAFLKALEGQTEGLTLAEASKLGRDERSPCDHQAQGQRLPLEGADGSRASQRGRVSKLTLPGQTEK